MIEFFAQADSEGIICRELEKCTPTNPFYTAKFALSKRDMGSEPWVLGLREENRIVGGCTAFLQRGALNNRLEICSIYEAISTDVFWNGLMEFCKRAHITELEVGSFGSLNSDIPPLPGEVRRRVRWEFPLDLRQTDWQGKIHQKHRKRIRQAQEQGIEIRRSTDLSDLDRHQAVIMTSMQRRSDRGEIVPAEISTAEHALYLTHGAGELFQALKDGQVVSSYLVLYAERGIYTHSSGNTPEGMRCGASHLLQFEILNAAQRESKDLCTLGGVDDLDSGLAQFKTYFGGDIRPLQAASFYLGSTLRRRLTTAVRLWRQDRRALVSVATGKLDRWKVFVVKTESVPTPSLPADISFRKLMDADLNKIEPVVLRHEQLARSKALGFNGAYAVFVKGAIAHVSWLLTQEFDKVPPPLVALKRDEAEITACVTLPEYRGRGLYGIAIQSICQVAREQGIQRVFMKTKPSNTASQKGIQKAGLKACGQILQVIPPLFPRLGCLVYRGHRWRFFSS